METKTFEVRDRATFLAVLAVKLSPSNPQDLYLLRRSGFSPEGLSIVLTRLEGGKSTYDPYEWGNRTLTVAHDHIIKNWHSLPSGSVVDVEFILRETSAPKKSESEELGL